MKIKRYPAYKMHKSVLRISPKIIFRMVEQNAYHNSRQTNVEQLIIIIFLGAYRGVYHSDYIVLHFYVTDTEHS